MKITLDIPNTTTCAFINYVFINKDTYGRRKRGKGMINHYRVSEYTDFSLGDGLPYCRWVVREGSGTRYWAMTTCKRGFNPLTKVRHVGDIKKVYDGCYCPQEAVNNTPIEVGKWHCFDIPFIVMTSDKATAEFYRDMLSAYDWTKCKECLQIGWGR